MKHFAHSALFVFSILVGLMPIAPTYGQSNNSYTLALVTAKVVDQNNEKDIAVVYSVSSKDSINFPPVFSIPPKCRIVNVYSKQDVILSNENMHVIFVGRDVKTKNPDIYELIKAKVNLSQPEALLFLVFELYNISSGKIEKMEMEVGIRETNKQVHRNNHFFSFNVEQ